MMDIDDSDVRRYIAELDKVPTVLDRELIKVGERGALNIKRDWRAAWSGHSYIGPLPRSITYERRTRVKNLEWEIGPDKSRAQGALGNVIEFGTVHNPPIPGGLPALEREAPRTERALSDVLGRVLGG